MGELDGRGARGDDRGREGGCTRLKSVFVLLQVGGSGGEVEDGLTALEVGLALRQHGGASGEVVGGRGHGRGGEEMAAAEGRTCSG